ncbi:MAG: glycoside hydrolase, partial [Bacillati bacterium ANGP1]
MTPSHRFICVHGHFYQPPRENPWLEEVEVQDSARPYHDWNARITAECYAPNGASRILDDDRRIAEITNNYRRISFNIGPTLLAWLEGAAPVTYEQIIAADQASRGERGGHGNALAQPYNHVILPLATRRDKETQVAWGIADFRARFGRDPEGMWLPETAVDTETLEVLAAHGIRFTILAPRQAARARPPGRDWIDVRGGRIDPSRPYLCRLPAGAA